MAFNKAKLLQEAEKSVSQGKISHAIKQYQEILHNDPADVSLLNTIGDLYIRDRNISEGLKQFQRLAEAFVRDGFNVKAIAIYRKISKVDPNSVETLLKLAELYQLQGLSREAREQYLQATEFYKKRKEIDRALDVLRKLVQLDPENINFRNRLAAECDAAGRGEDAARAYIESAEILLRRDDQPAAETALRKAADLDPRNSRVQLMRARIAIARQEPDVAEKIINASPDLQSNAAGKRILLDSYLGLRRLTDAERLVLEVFHANPGDFGPVANVSALLVENGEIEKAYDLLAGVADSMISQHNAGPVLEALRRIWSAAPAHIPTLELIHRVCEQTADESTLPEVLEALGHVYEESGDLEKAEAAYLKLVEREPENETFHGLLNAIQKKLGREIKPVDFSSREMALVVEEPPPKPPAADANQDAMVKEAFENSDLFSRYNLTEKAIGELNKVLQVYPDQIEVHQRILEIARKGFPDRAAAAAAQLSRIFTAQGDHELASKYHDIASAKGSLHEIPLPQPPPIQKVETPAAPSPVPPEPAAATPAEFTLTPIAPTESAVEAPAAPPPAEAAFDLTPPVEPGEPPAAPPTPPMVPPEAMELDLSGDLDHMAAFGFAAPAPSVEASPVPLPAAEIPAPAELPLAADEPLPMAMEIPAVAEEAVPAPAEEAPVAEAPAAAEEPSSVSVENRAAVEEPAAPPVIETPIPVEHHVAAAEAPMFTDELVPEAAEVPVAAEEPEAIPAEPAAVVDPPAPVGESATAPAPPATARVEASAQAPEALPLAEKEEIPVELEDSRIEVEFYLENGFIDEAQQAVAALEEKYPHSTLVAELRRRLTEPASRAPAPEPVAEVIEVNQTSVSEPSVEIVPEEEPFFAEPPAPAVQAEEAVVAEPPLPAPAVQAEEAVIAEPPAPAAEVEQAAVVEPPPPSAPLEGAVGEEAHPTEPPAAEVAHPEPEVAAAHEVTLPVEEPASDEWDLPTTYAAGAPSAAALDPSVLPAEAKHEAPAPADEFSAPPHTQEYVIEESAAAEAGGMDMLGDLAGDLASSLDGMVDASEASAAPSAASPSSTSSTPPAAGLSHGAAQLSGLLAEMEDPGDAAAAAAKDDPETHYNLGVAFREMGLLDEAIGEFQKVVKGAGKGKFPINFLQACSLLAICFMEKKMPAIAVKWYNRALETPGLDEEASLALQYDLGLAYEQAGDSRNALERFTEVYSQNIDFRDVADKIRELQQKA